MKQRDDRLHAAGHNRVDQVVVELQAFFIRLRIVAVGIDPRPVDRSTEGFQSQLLHQRQIILVGMIKINAAALGELPVLLDR